MLIYDFLTYRVLRRVAVYALFWIGCLPLLAAYNPAIDVDTYLDVQSYSRIREGVNEKKTFFFGPCSNFLNPPPP